MKTKPKAIFFDWDGTLVDTYSFLESGHNHVLESFALPPLEENGFRSYFGKPRDYIYDAIYGGQAEEAKKRFEVFVFENHAELLRPLEGAAALLETVNGFDIPMGVVSNKQPHFLEAEAKHLGWGKFFKSIVGASDDIPSKPSPRPLEVGLELAGLKDIDRAELCYVGDTEADLGCAKAMGCLSIFISHGEPIQSWVYDHEPDLIVQNCMEIKAHIDNFYGLKQNKALP